MPAVPQVPPACPSLCLGDLCLDLFQALRSSALWRGSLNPTSGWPGWHEQSAFPSLPGAGAPSGPGRWAQPLPACPHAGRIRQRSRVLGGDRGGQGDGAGSPRVRVLEAQVIRGWPFRQARPGWGRAWERGAVWGVQADRQPSARTQPQQPTPPHGPFPGTQGPSPDVLQRAFHPPQAASPRACQPKGLRSRAPALREAEGRRPAAQCPRRRQPPRLHADPGPSPRPCLSCFGRSGCGKPEPGGPRRAPPSSRPGCWSPRPWSSSRWPPQAPPSPELCCLGLEALQ